MAQGYYQVTGEFTRRIGSSLVVGNPKHDDVNGRYFTADESAAAAVVAEGLAKPISKSAYQKALDGEGEPAAGDNRLAQLSGSYPKVSAAWSTERLLQAAAERKVDVTSAKGDRTKIIKLINDAADSGDGTGPDPETSRGADETFLGRLGTLTSDTTGHDPRISPQNNVQGDGSVDRLQSSVVDGGASAPDGLTADEDAAPTGGGTKTDE